MQRRYVTAYRVSMTCRRRSSPVRSSASNGSPRSMAFFALLALSKSISTTYCGNKMYGSRTLARVTRRGGPSTDRLGCAPARAVPSSGRSLFVALRRPLLSPAGPRASFVALVQMASKDRKLAGDSKPGRRRRRYIVGSHGCRLVRRASSPSDEKENLETMKKLMICLLGLPLALMRLRYRRRDGRQASRVQSAGCYGRRL